MNNFTFILVQLLCSGLLILLLLSIIPVLLYPKLRSRILYRIQLSIAFSDLLQIVAIFQFSLYEFTGWELAQWIEKFSSGLFIIAWDHLIVQHFLLALNRLCIIYRTLCLRVNDKFESRLESCIFNTLLLLSWLLLIALNGLFMMPFCGGIWDSETIGFYYDTSLECNKTYHEFELYFTIALPALSICCYLAIIFILKKTRNTSIGTEASGEPNHQSNEKTLNSQEKRILIISVLLFSTMTALIYAWYSNYKWPPWTMLFCGYLLLNCTLMLTMNSEYRKCFLLMWRTCFCQSQVKMTEQQKHQLPIVVNGMQMQQNSIKNNLDALFIRRKGGGGN